MWPTLPENRGRREMRVLFREQRTPNSSRVQRLRVTLCLLLRTPPETLPLGTHQWEIQLSLSKYRQILCVRYQTRPDSNAPSHHRSIGPRVVHSDQLRRASKRPPPCAEDRHEETPLLTATYEWSPPPSTDPHRETQTQSLFRSCTLGRRYQLQLTKRLRRSPADAPKVLAGPPNPRTVPTEPFAGFPKSTLVRPQVTVSCSLRERGETRPHSPSSLAC